MVDPPLLAERSGPLAALDDLAKHAAGGTGRLAVVQAGPGLGKTVLLDTFRARLAGTGTRTLRARGSELERDFAYGIVRQLLTPVIRDPALRGNVLSGAAMHAEVLFSGHAPPGVARAFGGEQFEIPHALYWAVANLCDLGPVALLVDDAHDADAASLQLLTFLARRLGDLPLLLVVAVRSGHELGLPDGAELVSLDPLSADAAATIARDVLGAEPAAEFVGACMQATGGNPFYLHELLRAMAERAVAPTASNAHWVAELGPAAIVRRTLVSLAAVPGAVPLARALAILGEGVPMWTYARLADLPTDEAARAADALAGASILAPDGELRFAHPILRAAVLAELGSHSQRLWHARAAGLLDEAGYEPEVVGLHLLRADPMGDEHWRDILVRAGAATAREGSPAAAARLLRRALEECSTEASAELSYQLGLAEASLGRSEGLQRMAEGAAATPDPAERVHRALRTANFLMRSGGVPDAVRLLTGVREGVRDEADLLLAVDATRYWASRLHPELSVPRDVAELRRRADGPDTVARRTLLAYLACEAAQEDSAAAATELFERALERPGLLSFVPFDSVAVQAAMLSLSSIEHDDAFARLADAVLDEAGRRGALLAFLVVSTFRTLAMLRDGDLSGAAAEARFALDSAAEQGWQRGAASLAAVRAVALLELGDTDGADAAVAEAQNMYVAPGFPTALLLRARGRIAGAHGDLGAGIDALLACGRTLAEMGVHSPGVLPWRSDAALLLAEAGDVDGADSLAIEELDLARRLAGPRAVGRALYALARASRREDSVALLEQAHAVLATVPPSLVRAMVCVELGAAYRRGRNPRAARTMLVDGLDLALRCGCRSVADRARDELGVLGVAQSHTWGAGPSVLTPGELRVARLAAEGRTNTEIAQRLFVTRKTVEKHLGSAYRKLGIKSRDELHPESLPGSSPG